MIDINNFDAIEIGLASSKQIRGWSFRPSSTLTLSTVAN